MIDINKILEILPHRFPFLLVDRVIEYERGKRIVGLNHFVRGRIRPGENAESTGIQTGGEGP